MDRNRIAQLILRVGIAFAFLYASIDAFMDPYSWIDFFPQFIRGIIPDLALLHVFGVFEIIIAIWILSGVRIFLPSLIATVLLVAIVWFNLPEFQLLFRDLTIASASLALTISNTPRSILHPFRA